MRYEFIKQHVPQGQIRRYCEVLKVNRSGYYAWLDREPSQRQVEAATLSAVIREIHAASQENYGSPRVTRELQGLGYQVGHNRVAKLMQAAGLRGVMPRKTYRTTVADPGAAAIPDLLERDFSADKPNQKWVSDITMLPTGEGKLYLAVIIDLFSRKIVGWAMRADMSRTLVIQALMMAIIHRNPAPGLIHHSDHGSQYTSQDMQDLLALHGILPSMGSVGDCYDNAVAESGFATIKKECVHRYKFVTRQAAKTAIFQYIEVFYNRNRRHSSLGYLSPLAFENQFHQPLPLTRVH